MENPSENGHTTYGGANHLDNLIDEAGEESFPASDPPAVHTERGPVAKQIGRRDATTFADDRA